MRIIAGKYGGRKLVHFKADHIRPTTDRVKEAIFNKIQFSIEGAEILDLFSGTGNLAFEALSRGAGQVVAVELSKKSLAIMEKNKELLQVGGELKIIGKDVRKYLKTADQKFRYILIDPPFTEKMADEVLQCLSESQCFDGNTEVFIESSAHEVTREAYGSMKLKGQKNYGDKFLSHYIFD